MKVKFFFYPTCLYKRWELVDRFKTLFDCQKKD